MWLHRGPFPRDARLDGERGVLNRHRTSTTAPRAAQSSGRGGGACARRPLPPRVPGLPVRLPAAVVRDRSAHRRPTPSPHPPARAPVRAIVPDGRRAGEPQRPETRTSRTRAMSGPTTWTTPAVRSRISPKEPVIPLSLVLMPPPDKGPRPTVPAWDTVGTRPPFPGQRGAARTLVLALVAAVAAAALAAARAESSSVPSPIGPGLGNLRSPFSRAASGASSSSRPSPSLALAGWHRERVTRRERCRSFPAISLESGSDPASPRTPRPSLGRRVARTIGAARRSTGSFARQGESVRPTGVRRARSVRARTRGSRRRGHVSLSVRSPCPRSNDW
jgi:hypothetical protein